MGIQGEIQNIEHSIAEAMIERMTDVLNCRREEGIIKSYTFAGSYRRGVETVNDVDIIIFTEQPESEWEAILSSICYSKDVVERIPSKGPKKATVILKTGIQVDLLMAKPSEEGAMLLYFTGSPFFNIALRAKAKRMGMKLNERELCYDDGTPIAVRNTEREILKLLHLEYIPVEERSIDHSDWSSANKLFKKYRIAE
jgi:DNA polymerase (family 10)